MALLLGAFASAQTPPRQPRDKAQPCVIEGTIKLGGGDKIVSTPFVQLYNENDDLLQETFTDADGRFQMTNIYTGKYRLVIKLRGYAEAQETVEFIGRGGNTRRVMIELKPEINPNVIATATTVSMAQLQIPEKADKEYRKGKEKLKEQKFADAIKYFRKAVEAYPAFCEARSDLGLAYRLAGDPVSAEKEYRECLRQDDSYMFARLNLADLYAATNRPDEAVQLLEATILLHPKEGEPHVALGKLHVEAGRFDQAESECRKAVDLNDASPDTYLLLAKIYLQRQQIPELVQALEDYLQQAPDGPYAAQVRDALAKFKKQ
jgi:Flp pilus assembly protein TadD